MPSPTKPSPASPATIGCEYPFRFFRYLDSSTPARDMRRAVCLYRRRAGGLRHRRAGIVVAAAALTTALGAYGYTRLSNAGAALVIGAMLISSVPLRRLLKRRDIRIGDAGLAAGSVGYGVVVGGTSGSG